MKTPKITVDKKLFDRVESAHRIGVSTRYLDRKIALGEINVVRFGTRVKIHADELARIEREGLQ